MTGFDFNVGTAVHCGDGRCGRLTRVVDRDAQEVTDLIVEKGFLLKRAALATSITSWWTAIAGILPIWS